MNKVILMGRLTREPEVRYSSGETQVAVARFTLAVDRRTKKQEGQPTADFINCIAFAKSAEAIEKYVHKGTKITLCGHIQTGNYTNKDGVKVYTTDVLVDEWEFAESKAAAAESGKYIPPKAPDNDSFMEIPDDIDEQLPFA